MLTFFKLTSINSLESCTPDLTPATLVLCLKCKLTSHIAILGKTICTIHGGHSLAENCVCLARLALFGFVLQTLQMDVNKLNITLLRIFRQGVAAALGLLPQQVHINRLIVSGLVSCLLLHSFTFWK